MCGACEWPVAAQLSFFLRMQNVVVVVVCISTGKNEQKWARENIRKTECVYVCLPDFP